MYVFLCVQKSNTSLLDRLKADIANEPELARSRACELGAIACDGWTLLHAAARYVECHSGISDLN